MDINKDYEILLNELKEYNPELLVKERVLAITKSDMLDEELMEEMKKELPKGVKSIFISAITQKNINPLKDLLWEAIND
jgi:GTP-binding protein